MPQESEFERLFLLEFFIDHIVIKTSSFDNRQSTLCVSFQFLHYPVMRVCEEDFNPPSIKQLPRESKIVFKCGKSCLFSVHPDVNNRIPSQFNLVIRITQKSKLRDPPEKKVIGQTVVGLGNSFLNLLQPNDLSSIPTTGVKHDVFPVKDPDEIIIGSLAAFARLSCFGKLIITQIQLASEDDKKYMFKGTDEDNLFKDDTDFPIFECEDEDIPKDTPYEEIFGFPEESKREYIGEEAEEVEEDEEYEIKTEDLEKKPTESNLDVTICKQGGDENFKEIGAEVNGTYIIIRVLKKPKREKKEDPCDGIQQVCSCPPCCLSEPPVCPYAPKLNVCECDYPLPPELEQRCPPQCCQSPPPCCLPPSKYSPTAQYPSQFGNISNTKRSSIPAADWPANLFKPQSNNQNEKEGTMVAMKGDQVYYQTPNKPGEPMSDKDKKIVNSLYYKTCKKPSDIEEENANLESNASLNCPKYSETMSKKNLNCDQRHRISSVKKKRLGSY